MRSCALLTDADIYKQTNKQYHGCDDSPKFLFNLGKLIYKKTSEKKKNIELILRKKKFQTQTFLS